MTITSIHRDRSALWDDLFYDLGWDQVEPAWPGWHRLSLVFEAVKNTRHGQPPVRVRVEEVWVPGDDPQGLMPLVEGCHLYASSWNARFTGETDGSGQERMDLDRRHVGEEFHRHPLGVPDDDCREPQASLIAAEEWLARVEIYIARLMGH